MTGPLTHLEVLAQAGGVLADRQAQYGDAGDFLETFADLISVLLDQPVNLVTADLILIALKMARLKHRPDHSDSWTDIIGYAAIGGEIASMAQERKVA